jgi:hypothetical protein
MKIGRRQLVQQLFEFLYFFGQKFFVFGFRLFKFGTPSAVVVVNQAVVRSLTFLSVLHPLIALFENFFAFYVEVTADGFLESFGRVF